MPLTDKERDRILEGISRGRGRGRSGVGKGGPGQGDSSLPYFETPDPARVPTRVPGRDPREFVGEERAPRGGGEFDGGGGGGGGVGGPEAAPGEEWGGPPGGFIDDVMGAWREDVDPYWADARAGVDAYGRDLIGAAEGYRDIGMDTLDPLRGSADELLGIYEQGGLTDVTRAQLESNRRQADQFVRANREAALQDLAERGMAGGGAEVLALQGDRAAAADRMNAADLDAAAFGQESAMRALMDASGLQSDIGREERALHGEVAGAQALGANAAFDLSRHLSDMGSNLATELHRNTVQQIGDTFGRAERGAYDAARGVANLTGGAIDDATGRATGVISQGAGNMDFTPDLPGGSAAPGTYTTPAANTAGAVGGMVGAGADIAGAVGGTVASAWPQGGAGGGGGATGADDTLDSLGFTGQNPPTDEELLRGY